MSQDIVTLEDLPRKGLMRLITLHLPDELITFIDSALTPGWFPNRSEFIRHAIYDAIKDWRKLL